MSVMQPDGEVWKGGMNRQTAGGGGSEHSGHYLT